MYLSTRNAERIYVFMMIPTNVKRIFRKNGWVLKMPENSGLTVRYTYIRIYTINVFIVDHFYVVIEKNFILHDMMFNLGYVHEN